MSPVRPNADAVADPESSDPRAVRSRAAVIGATIDLMVERGMHAVSVDAIAERSGVAKTTVYRHWPTREALILAAWYTLVPEEVLAPTGDLTARIHALALAFAHRNGAPPMSVLLPELLAYAGRDPEMAAIYEEILRVRGKPLTEAVAAAVEEGLLPAHTDVDLTASLILGPIAFQQLILRNSVGPEFVGRVVTIVMESAMQELVQRPAPKPKASPPARRR